MPTVKEVKKKIKKEKEDKVEKIQKAPKKTKSSAPPKTVKMELDAIAMQNKGTVSYSEKKVCVRCSVLGLGSPHRQVHELTTPARARLACPNARATRVCGW